MFRRSAMRLHFWLSDRERQIDRSMARMGRAGTVLHLLHRLLR